MNTNQNNTNVNEININNLQDDTIIKLAHSNIQEIYQLMLIQK